MEQMKETLVGFSIGIGIYGCLVEVLGCILSTDRLSFTLGLLFGIAIAFILIIHMARSLNEVLNYPPETANKSFRKGSIFRVLIMLAGLGAGMAVPCFQFVAVVLGMFGLKVGALTAPVFLRLIYPDHYITKPEAAEGVEESEDAQ